MSQLAGRIRRVLAMPPREIADRARGAARQAGDRVRTRVAPSRWRREHLAARLEPSDPAVADVRRYLAARSWPEAGRALAAHIVARDPRFVVHPSLRTLVAGRVSASHPGAAADATSRLERIAAGGYDVLGLKEVRFDPGGDGRVDWHLDPISQRRPPRVCWAEVPYLDPAIGDHKVIWEINRHQHWLALGRAWWLTGDTRARTLFTTQLADWLAANPPLVGINWASALELAFRAMSWTWALELFASEDEDATWTLDLLLGLDRQLTQVERHLSRYFSPNTHLLGEALALYVCGRAWPELAASRRRADVGRSILLQEATRQVLPDGGHAERSPHYHRYALDFYMLALAVARATGDTATARILAPTALAMAAYLHHFCDGRGRFPQIGDDDGGELAPVAGQFHGDARVSLGWAARLLGEPALAIEPVPEAVLWLTANPRTLPVDTSDEAPYAHRTVTGDLGRSRLFESSGYVAVQRGTTRLVFDAGPLGFLNGGHAHADGLAVTLTVGGEPLLVDPGTATYTMDARLRDRLRSSAWHNTLSIGDESQSRPGGPFNWLTKATARFRHVVLATSFDYAEADTDGWGPARHERIVLCVGEERVFIADRVRGHVPGTPMLNWHLSPEWLATLDDEDEVLLRHRTGLTARLASVGSTPVLHRADPASGLGWISPAYGALVASTTVSATMTDPDVGALTIFEQPTASQRWRPLAVPEVDDVVQPFAVLAARDGPQELIVLRSPGPRQPLPVALDDGRGTVITSDARALHVRFGPDAVVERLCAVEVARIACEGASCLVVSAERPIADLAVVVREDRSPLVETSIPRSDIRVTCDAPTAAGR